jgi:hypothetical protein
MPGSRLTRPDIGMGGAYPSVFWLLTSVFGCAQNRLQFSPCWQKIANLA